MTAERRLHWSLLAGICLVGLALRLHNLEINPRADANWDELDWAWVGVSLLSGRGPTGWSLYQLKHQAYAGHVVGLVHIPPQTTIALVRPWLDHPPLFALLVGAWSWLSGAHTIEALTFVGTIRPLAVILSTATLALTYVLGARIVGPRVALLSVAFMAVTPAAIILGRIVESEQLLTPIWLLTLLAALAAVDGRRRLLPLVLLGCAITPLIKVPGIVVGLSVAGAFLYHRRWTWAAGAAAAAVVGLAAFGAWGAAWDWTDFQAVVLGMAHRKENLLSGYVWLVTPTGDNSQVPDPWWIFGWLGIAAAAALGRKESIWLAWPAAAYLLLMTALASIDWASQYGWYRIPVLPFAYLGTGYLLREAWRRRHAAFMALAAALPSAGLIDSWRECLP